MDVRAAMILPLETHPVVRTAKDINIKGLEEALDTLVEEPI